MKIIGVIPARYKSTRFPGKPLADIHGKPMIWWVWNTAKKVSLLDEVYIATDDEQISASVKAFGGEVLMTGNCATGTDRVAEVAHKTNGEIYVNIQGDEPMIKPETISQAIKTVADDRDYFGTLAIELKEQNEIENPNNVKIVLDSQNYAMFFSRSPIPSNVKGHACKVYKHIGIYVYRKGFLIDFARMKTPEIELGEAIEPLRAMYYGFRIRVGLTKNDSIGVDTPTDLENVRKLLLSNEVFIK